MRRDRSFQSFLNRLIFSGVSVSSSLQFDLGQISFLDALGQLRSTITNDETAIDFLQCAGRDFVGSGLRCRGKIQFVGNLGDFACTSFGNGDATVEGNVGDFFGHSIQSGSLIVRGHAKESIGALGAGGLITVYGNAGDRVATGLTGADVVIRGSVGNWAALGMKDGILVIGGNAGEELGKGIQSGTIYVRGDIQSLSPDIEEVRMREPDRLKVGLLMLKSGIKSTGKEFRVYRSVS